MLPILGWAVTGALSSLSLALLLELGAGLLPPLTISSGGEIGGALNSSCETARRRPGWIKSCDARPLCDVIYLQPRAGRE